jgi:putative membrane protein
MKRNRTVIKVAGACAGLAGATPVLAHTGQDGGWDHHGMMWGNGMGWFMGPIAMILFLVVAVAVVALVVRWLGGTGGGSGGDRGLAGSSALQILEERFARGEIDQEEFLQRKKALEE